MNEEEAIETIKHWVEYEKQNKEKINKADELIEVQEIVLNMLERLKEEKNEVIEISEVEYHDLSGEIHRLEIELEKKDKIIEELAKAFKQDDVRSVEEIIRYFEEKIKDE